MNAPMPPQKPIVIGKILTTHGVHGQMKVQSMMHNPKMLEQMTPFWIMGKPFAQWSLFKPTGRYDLFLGKLPEISTMNDALELRHGHIVVDRSQLPTMDGEIYYADLEKKPVIDCNGLPLGSIKHVHDFGAGPVLELDPSGLMVSFHAIMDADSDIIQLNIASAILN